MKVHQLFKLLILVALCSIVFANNLYSQQRNNRVSTIVIDPGHGGKDPGTMYGKTYEKNIVLSVALKLGALIESRMPDVKVIYTRSTDVYIELATRGAIANNAKADIFLSIHVDATTGPSAHGSSSWVMGLDKSQKNLSVAMRENDVVSIDDDYSQKYEGYIAGSAESYIMFSLLQYANTDQSMALASLIQKHYQKTASTISNRGAKQGPFLVLWRTTMPSVLTEIGFMSNPNDRAFLISQTGQNKIAESLYNAIKEYKSNYEVADVRPTISQPQNNPTTNHKVKFWVQVASSPNILKPNHRSFKSYKGQVERKKAGTLYKYVVGETTSYAEALALQQSVRREIKDAFVVAFDGDAPISVVEAKAILGQ